MTNKHSKSQKNLEHISKAIVCCSNNSFFQVKFLNRKAELQIFRKEDSYYYVQPNLNKKVLCIYPEKVKYSFPKEVRSLEGEFFYKEK